MAKKRSSTPHRDTQRIASDPLAEAVYLPLPLSPIRLQPIKKLTEVQDHRLYYPEPVKPSRSTTGGSSRVVIRPAKNLQGVRSKNKNVFGPNGLRKSQRSIPSGLAFDLPKRVVVCVRRQQRREVLFAKKSVRSGAGAKRRRTRWSDISC